MLAGLDTIKHFCKHRKSIKRQALPVRSGVSIALLEVLEKLGLLQPLVYGVSLATGL